MSIRRLFASKDDASSAVTELVDNGLLESTIEIVPVQGVGAETANGFAVIVEAPLGTAGLITSILATPRASDVGTPTVVDDRETTTSSSTSWVVLLNHPTPLSSLFFQPTIFSDGNPTNLGLPLLTSRKKMPESAFGLPLLASAESYFSSLIGLKMLLNNPAPLSSLFKIPTITPG